MRRLVSAVSVSLALTLVACGGGSREQSGSTENGAGQSGPAGTSSGQTGSPFFQFQGRGPTGSTLNGADLAGKDVAFWFWAPW